jgi:hypothetical protein
MNIILYTIVLLFDRKQIKLKWNEYDNSIFKNIEDTVHTNWKFRNFHTDLAYTRV